MNNVYQSVREMIGNTPVLKINNMGVKPGVNVFAKLELMNPEGSVKDRVGVYMIDDAVRRGVLKEGGTIVDATAGNTGIGIAVAALNQGYRVIFTVPEKFSIEKQKIMQALGAEIVHTPREEGMLGADRKADEIICIFNSYRESDELVHDTYFLTDVCRYRSMRHRCRVAYEGLDSAETLCECDKVKLLEEDLVVILLIQHERDHRTGTVCLLPVGLISGISLKTGVIYLAHITASCEPL